MKGTHITENHLFDSLGWFHRPGHGLACQFTGRIPVRSLWMSYNVFFRRTAMRDRSGSNFLRQQPQSDVFYLWFGVRLGRVLHM